VAGGEVRADVVVVGLGLIGSGAVRHLAAEGAQVVGIGPGEPDDWSTHPGPFASHYDSGRITRMLDARFEWAELAVRAIGEYPVIAAESGIAFHHGVGAVFASRDPAFLDAIDSVGRRVGADHRIVVGPTDGPSGEPSGGPAGAAGPEGGDGEVVVFDDGRITLAEGRLALPAGCGVVAEPPPAGFIDPRRMLRAQLAAATSRGALVVDDEVVAVEPAGPGWRVTTAGGTVASAPLVLLATGAHTDEVGPAAGRFAGAVRPETVVLASLDRDEAERLAGIPSAIAQLHGTSFADLYQVPPTEYPDGSVRLKLGATLREWAPLGTGAQRRAWMSGDAHERHLAELRGLVEDLVPGIRAEAWATKPCMITDTASGLPTVAHLAHGLVVAAGGNGYAAKSADAIGALGASLLLAGFWTDPVLAEAAFALAGPPPG
jgi:sarcosine oxidase